MAKTTEKAQQSAIQLSDFKPGMQVCFPPNGIGTVAPKPDGRPPKISKGKVPIQVRGKITWFLPEELRLHDAELQPEATPEAQPEASPEPLVEVPVENRVMLLKALTIDFQSDIVISTELEYASALHLNRHLKTLESEGLVESQKEVGIGGFGWRITDAGADELAEIDPWFIPDIFTVLAYGEKVEVTFDYTETKFSFSFRGDIDPSGGKDVYVNQSEVNEKLTPKQYALELATQLRVKYLETPAHAELKKEEEPIKVGDWVTTQTLRTPSEQYLDNGGKHQMYAKVTAIRGKKAHISWFNSQTQTADLYDLHKFSPEYVAKIEVIEQEKLSAIVGLDQMSLVERELAMDLAQLDETTRDRIQQRTDRIQSLKRGVAADLVEIGKELIDQKLDIGREGSWLNWLELNGWQGDDGMRDAQYLMSVAETFGNLHPNTCSFFDYSAMKLLAAKSVSKDPAQLEVRERFLKSAEQGIHVRHKDVKAALSEVKAPAAIPPAKPPKAPANQNQGYSPTELKTNSNTNGNATSVDADVKEQAQALGLSANGSQTLPDVVRNSPPAEVDDRPFAYEMAYTNPAIDVSASQSEDSGEDYTAFVEAMTEQEATELVAAIGNRFGASVLNAALEALKAGVS